MNKRDFLKASIGAGLSTFIYPKLSDLIRDKASHRVRTIWLEMRGFWKEVRKGYQT